MSAAPESPTGPAALPALASRIRTYWETTGVPARSAAGDPNGPIFRFTEGPPTANGRPHVGHLVARILKDAALRYRRMQGYRIISPMAGWDCHGLPVELEMEKRLGFRSKREIEAYGVAQFNAACRASVLEVASVWMEMSRRLGYWLDYEHAYRTMDAPYIESVWWSLKRLFDAHLLEKGYYVLPYCPRCETPLASHEVAQGYKDATDPSVTIRVRLDGAEGAPPEFVLVWTTTPWTLPSNLLIAARSDLSYAGVDGPDGSRYWLAESALPRYAKEAGTVRERREGRSFLGRSYTPPFPFAGLGPGRFRIVLDDMVNADDGTGFVHIAPSFGPDDQRIGQREGVSPFDPLDARAVFTDAVPPVVGKGFKVADPILVEALRDSGQLVRAETIRHTYPFCWRCATPLIYRAIDSWFVRTSRFNGPLVAYNATVEWHPAHLRDGRFGNFLTEAKDWAVSRNRFWGTPLPVWVCGKGHPTCIGSYQELAERSGGPLPKGFDPHRAGVDPIRFPCPTCGEEARREPYTIDGWYDSGSAPFAQFHYPFEPGPFDPKAPLDYVAEGLDQTRGWFYTLHVLSTALFDRPAYRVCVANGMILDEAGQKMSKSKGNVLDPLELLERHGGDAVRWAFLTVDYTEPARFGDAAFRRAGGRTLGTLLNVLAFYSGNALADHIPVPSEPPAVSAVLDRWILPRLDRTIEEVTEAMERSEDRLAALALQGLVDDLSLWWLRRSRTRFWVDDDPEDRSRAHQTLSYTLSTLARLMAPFTPFLAEHLHQTVHRLDSPTAADSVHLTRWPASIHAKDPALEATMAEAREQVEIGRELRQRAQIRSRTPLPEIRFAGERPELGELDEVIADELNVLKVRREPKISEADLLDTEWVLRQDDAGGVVAALPRKAPPALVEEGWRREGLRRLQMMRKDLNLGYTERISLQVRATGALYHALSATPGRVQEELLLNALELSEGPTTSDEGWHAWEIDGEHLSARRVSAPSPGG